MPSAHYRPYPRGYFRSIQPFSPTPVTANRIVSLINRGLYKVEIIYTDTEVEIKAPVVKRITGKRAEAKAIKLINDWKDGYGCIERCESEAKRRFLNKELYPYKNLYCKLRTDHHELIALIRK